MARRSWVIVILLLLSTVGPAAGQERNRALSGVARPGRVDVPVLEVRQSGGEFERWGRELSVDAPKAEVFRWGTRAAGVVSGTWKVMDGPPGSSAEVLGTGSAGRAPGSGRVSLFRIDFTRVFPSGPRPGTSYWVVVEPVDASGRKGLTSMPVRMTYVGSTNPEIAGRIRNVYTTTPRSGPGAPKSFKIGFLRDLARELGEEALVEAGFLPSTTVPDASVRLTPVEPLASSNHSSSRHNLAFRRPAWVHFAGTGVATFEGDLGRTNLRFYLEPNAIFLVDVQVEAKVNLTLEMGKELTSPCYLDFQSDTKEFPLIKGSHHLLATIQRVPELAASIEDQTSLCPLYVHIVPGSADYTSSYQWKFESAELTKLSP